MPESIPPAPAPGAAIAEERFRRLLEAAPDAMVITNREGRIVLANKQVQRVFGYSSAELIGQPVEVLVPESFRDRHIHHRADFNAEPRTRSMGIGLELFARRKDGSVFPVEISLSPLQTGEEFLITAAIRDITERKRAEQALRESEERFRLLVEEVKDYAIFMLDTEGRIRSWNEGAQRIEGYKASEIIGEHFSRLHPPEEAAHGKPDEELRLAATDGRWEEAGWRVRKDGSRFWANVVTTALRDPQGRLVGFTKVVRDITEHKRAQEAFLLEITNALVSNLDLRQLLGAVASCLHQAKQFDFATLALYDPETKTLKSQILDANSPPGEPAETLSASTANPVGWTFTHRKPLLWKGLPHEHWPFEMSPLLLNRGVKSACWLPLVGRQGVLGTLNLLSQRPEAFGEEDLKLFGQIGSQVAIAVENAMAFQQVSQQKQQLAEEKLYLEDEIRAELNFGEIIGRSRALQQVLRQIETVAPTDSTVLIMGETGTGKELIARAVHNLSARREKTFVRVNCASIPAGLLESELFGHEKGAFTGALTQRIGRIELAHRGTLFLDEVGDIPLELQSKLLRVLQEREFERLGSSRTITSDARIVAATNRDLAKMVASGEFRADLYYRLNVFPITVPPLRERTEDIALLVQFFVSKYSRRMKKAITAVPAETMQALTAYSWPGNVRELEHLIERAVILSPGPDLKVPSFEFQPSESQLPKTSAALEDVEREHIIRVLRQTKGKISGPGGAAERLGMNRTTLNSRMRKLGISRSQI